MFPEPSSFFRQHPAARSSLPRIGFQSWPEWIGSTALVALTWLMLLRFPVLTPLALDPSWRVALSYLTETELQFGKDIVFTYGPWGYVLASIATGINHAHHIAWQLGANLIFAVTLVGIARRLRGIYAVSYYAYFLGLAVGYPDALYVTLALLYSLLLLRDSVLRSRSLTIIFSVVLAVLSLTKFTSFLLAGIGIFSVAAWLIWHRRWPELCWMIGSFTTSFVAGWMAWGQSPLNIPAFIINSLSISDGYVDIMGVPATPGMFACGLISAFALVVYFASVLWGAEDRPRSMAALGVTGAAAFLSWKHGFVRADGHVVAHFFLCLAVIVCHPALMPKTVRGYGIRAVAITICVIASLAGIWQQSWVTLADAGAIFNHRLRENITNLVQLPGSGDRAKQAFQDLEQELSMPSLRALARGDKRVDVMGHDLGFAIVNGVNYRPRPTLQSYAAMTPRLADLNAAFMADPSRAPEVVISRIQTIDDRLPTLDDAPALRYLYHHYDYVSEETGFLLWIRRDFDPALDTRELLSEQTLGFTDPIIPPADDNHPIWCELEIKPSLLGRLRQFLYKPPVLMVKTDDGGSDQRLMRIAPAMARAGFFAYPYFTNNQNIINYQKGGPAPRLMQLSLVLEPDEAKFYAPEITARFFRLPPFPRTENKDVIPPAVRFRSFNLVPHQINSPIAPEIVPFEGNERMLVHAPSEMIFNIAPGISRAKGSFGLFEGAYTNGGETDGVEFRVDWIEADGTRKVLWQRLLLPQSSKRDQGRQSFEIELPSTAGQAALVTTNGPADHVIFDWAYWQQVVFQP